MKKNVKKIINLILLFTIIFSFTNIYAFNTGDVKDGATNFLSQATSAGSYDATIAPTISGIADLVMGIGVIALIVTGLIIAMKTMSDGATGRAQLKESLTPYFIGCIVIIAGWSIWKIIVEILQ